MIWKMSFQGLNPVKKKKNLFNTLFLYGCLLNCAAVYRKDEGRGLSFSLRNGAKDEEELF